MMETRSQRSGSTIAGAIFGNYRIVEPLDRGGMGSVYRAQHTVLGRPAAVKILRPELTTNEQLVQRFLNEAKAATLIRHPGIVEVYDYGTTDQGISYLVMELLEGVPLSQRLAERGRLPEAEAVVVVRGIASALKAAHREGIVHRDLKPVNVFLVPDPDGPTGERIKVLDFGIAKLIDPKRAHHTQTGALIGTPIYMAPEQARAAHAIDHRADLYSLGCMLYELVVGRPPFQAIGAGEVIAMHLFTPPEPPSRQVPVSPELERIVLRLLEKEPAERFQNAGELIDALDAAAGHPARPPGAAAVAAVADSMPYAVPQIGGGFRLSLADEAPMRAPEKRSAMGLVAAAITVAIAAAGAIFILTRGGGDGEESHAKPAAGSGGEGSGAEPQPAPSPAAAPAPAPAPAPVPAPPAPEPAPPPQPAKEAASKPAGAPVTERAKHPPTSHRTKPADKEKPGASSGPVTHPDGPVTRPDSGGPVTTPGGGARTENGSPINLGLDPEKKPAPAPPPPPAAAPAPPPPPPPAADKLPDKPAEGTP